MDGTNYFAFEARCIATDRPADNNRVTVKDIIELPDDEPSPLAAGHIEGFTLPDGFNLVGQIKVTQSSVEVWEEWQSHPGVIHVGHGHGHYEIRDGWPAELRDELSSLDMLAKGRVFGLAREPQSQDILNLYARGKTG